MSLLPELLPLLLKGLDLPADFSRCLHIALRRPVLPQMLHLALRNRCTPLSRVQLCHSRHTWTSRHQFPLAWADCSSPPSFASTAPHSHTTLSRRKCRSRDRSLGLFQDSSRECFTSFVSQRGHVHLLHQLQPSQPLISLECQKMSTGTETRLRASPLQRSCRIARASFQTRSCRSGHRALVSRAPSHGQK